MTGRFETFERDVQVGEESLPTSEYGWRLLAGNGEPVAASEGYTSRSDAERGARDVIQIVTDLVLEAGDEDLVEVFEA